MAAYTLDTVFAGEPLVVDAAAAGTLDVVFLGQPLALFDVSAVVPPTARPTFYVFT